MKTVIGRVKSTKPVRLSKAAAIVGLFAAAGAAEGREMLAFLDRAAGAFDELHRLHREIKRRRKVSRIEIQEREEEDCSARDSGVSEVDHGGVVDFEGKRLRSSKKKRAEERKKKI